MPARQIVNEQRRIRLRIVIAEGNDFQLASDCRVAKRLPDRRISQRRHGHARALGSGQRRQRENSRGQFHCERAGQFAVKQQIGRFIQDTAQDGVDRLVQAAAKLPEQSSDCSSGRPRRRACRRCSMPAGERSISLPSGLRILRIASGPAEGFSSRRAAAPSFSARISPPGAVSCQCIQFHKSTPDDPGHRSGCASGAAAPPGNFSTRISPRRTAVPGGL